MKTLEKTSLQQSEREAFKIAMNELKSKFPVDKLVLFCGMSQQEIIDSWIEKAEHDLASARDNFEAGRYSGVGPSYLIVIQ